MCRSDAATCEHREPIGSFRDGGFAEQLVVPVLNLHAVPDNVPDESRPGEPLACAIHAWCCAAT